MVETGGRADGAHVLGRLLARYPVATEEVWRTTVNVARVHTPNQAINQTPAKAQAWLDIRFPAEDADLNGRAAVEVADYLGSFCDPGVEVEIDQLDPPQHADHDRPEIAALRLAANTRATAATSCLSTAPVTAGSIPVTASRRWPSASVEPGSTVRRSTRTSRPSRRTTVR